MDNKKALNGAEEEFKEKTGAAEKIKKVRNQFMLKKGAYSIAITALVLAALILVNWLVSTLGARFHLEFDMTRDKTYSVNEENLNYIKNVKEKITITVLSAEYNYTSNLSQMAEYYMGVSGGDEYYDQTLSLLEKYKNYNDNIKLVFVDSSDMAFKSTVEKYSNDSLFYGDIIVTNDNNSRYKVVHFEDIYQFDSSNVYYGYGTAVEGNNLETALTSAITYCVAEKTPRAVIFTGHSDKDYSEYYTGLLENYNYDFDVMGNKMITEISDEYDLAVIIAPTSDFTEGELDCLSAFLENGGKLSKSLMYFASASVDPLPHLEEFLGQWGIVKDGYVVIDDETMETAYYQFGDPTVLISEPAQDQDEETFDNAILSRISSCVTSNNAPFEIGTAADPIIKTNGVIKCSDTSIVASVADDGENYTYTEHGEKQCYTVIEAKKTTYDTDNNVITSYVYAFSSVDFIGQLAEYQGYSNKNIVLACSDRAAHFTSEGLDFITKTIVNDTYVTNDKEVKRVRIIFQWALPLLIVALSIFVYVRRRNA